ncbi:NAD-binding protein [Fomitiporia mediterranea MF3/22]|uniref:NAD-binding protein n=1 Tax=Fomitiporia mediterranea (strain MF3/22) TaxID=694068 RepID=UPI0004409220|nr:NAD-binding protein [Fomitiporia mediterranea MF3/22]EJD06799.1 NAD-binding protein [Fomitiporia mediterranea MF3/22]
MSTVPFTSYTPRVAIITGGAQGIGYAISQRLADDGIDVAVNDIAAKQKEIDAVVEEIRKKGRRAIAIPGDVSSEADVISMVETAIRELGSIDIARTIQMVANAGIAPLRPLVETPVEMFDSAIAVNARGAFLCFKHAARQMIKQGRGGRMIAASSVAGKQGGNSIVSYSASKFAIRGIAQSASTELHDYGITVNTYAPGGIRTPMLLAAGEEAVRRVSATAQIGVPECIASIVSYLAKPESYFGKASPLMEEQHVLIKNYQPLGKTKKKRLRLEMLSFSRSFSVNNTASSFAFSFAMPPC